LSKRAIIGCYDGSGAGTAVDEGDFSEIVACVKQFLVAGRDSFMVFHFHFALTLGDKVEKGSIITLAYNLIIRALDKRRYANN